MSYAERFWNQMMLRHDASAADLAEHLPNRHIDEMSIYFRNEAWLDELVRTCEQTGHVDHFNSTTDIVQQMIDGKYTEDSASFGVRFEFLQHDKLDYRCEAMYIKDGWSPVHNVLRDGDIAHASFKCQDTADYSMVCLELVGKGYKQLAEFRNGYGLFSYFVTEFAGPPYIKPRVNLRDA
jgi:hypothetical protein